MTMNIYPPLYPFPPDINTARWVHHQRDARRESLQSRNLPRWRLRRSMPKACRRTRMEENLRTRQPKLLSRKTWPADAPWTRPSL